MEEMKNLVIQTLETRGVLGQIRAKLRSTVFKIVDDQDQRTNQPMGCGLKWENPLLYKIRDTNVGGLISELIREFMEHMKMDYSLSVFIPECSISPERLKRDEILARLGLNSSSYNLDFPIIYLLIFYFIDSLHKNPENVYHSLNNMVSNDIEKLSDELIMQNLYNYQTSNINYDNQNNNPINNYHDESKISEPFEEKLNKISENKSNYDLNQFEKLNDYESGKRKSFEYEDRKINNLDSSNYSNVYEDLKKQKKDDDIGELIKNNRYQEYDIVNEKENQTREFNEGSIKPVSNKNENLSYNRNRNTENSLNTHNEIDDIEEEIMIEEDEIEELYKNPSSNNNIAISQSGNDFTVDSTALEKYNYIEPVEN